MPNLRFSPHTYAHPSRLKSFSRLAPSPSQRGVRTRVTWHMCTRVSLLPVPAPLDVCSSVAPNDIQTSARASRRTNIRAQYQRPRWDSVCRACPARPAKAARRHPRPAKVARRHPRPALVRHLRGCAERACREACTACRVPAVRRHGIVRMQESARRRGECELSTNESAPPVAWTPEGVACRLAPPARSPRPEECPNPRLALAPWPKLARMACLKRDSIAPSAATRPNNAERSTGSIARSSHDIRETPRPHALIEKRAHGSEAPHRVAIVPRQKGKRERALHPACARENPEPTCNHTQLCESRGWFACVACPASAFCVLCATPPPKNGIEIDRPLPTPPMRRRNPPASAEEGWKGKLRYFAGVTVFSPVPLASPQPQSVYRFSSLTIASFVPLPSLPFPSPRASLPFPFPRACPSIQGRL